MILYFSATGNCKYVAERIAGECHEEVCSIVDRDPHITLAKNETLGIVTPVNWWELPVLTREFLAQLCVEQGGDNYTFLVVTYGSMTGCCGADAKHILHKRGLTLDAAFGVKTPDNWTPMFDLSDPEKVAAINRRAEGYIDRVIQQVQTKATGNHTEHRLPYFIRLFADPLLNKQRMTKHFYVEDSCAGCGLCAEKCPVKAIELRNGKPVWVRERCALCLGCLHRCPQFAIQYGNGKTKQHGQYRNPHTTI